MKKLILISILFSASFAPNYLNAQVKNIEKNILSSKKKIHKNLDQWHKAAANANFEEYFNLMAEDAIFIGTDATENWTLPEFKKFSKPYFDAGKAWDFTAIERYIYLNEDRKIAWFDELLDTQMGICRGSGTLVKKGGKWEIKHYVLSIAIPNDHVSEITKIKKKFDEELISKLKKN